jgi:hypothetical protein
MTRRRSVRRRVVSAVSVVMTAVTVTALLPAASAVAAGSGNTVCVPDNRRVSIPPALPVSACFDGHTLYVVNRLNFPIEVHTDPALTPEVSATDEADVPGSILARSLPADGGLIPPNYEQAIPVGEQQTTVRLTTAPDQLVSEWVWTKQLYDVLGDDEVVKLGPALASLVDEVATNARNYRACVLSSSWLGKIGCFAGCAGNLAFTLARFGIKAFTPSATEASYDRVMDALDANHAARRVSAMVAGAKQFTISAATQPGGRPPRATPPPVRPNRGVVVYHVEDDFLGGTWARTDPSDGRWYPPSTRPSNGASWYPNGLRVSVDCARSAAAYPVRYADGHEQTWTWWLRVVGGKWYPAAATREIDNDGNPGVATC